MTTSQLLGNFGEFIAALAVVATLFYLAVQVRHSRESVDANTRALDESRKVQMAEAFQARLQNMSANARLMAGSTDLLKLMVKLKEVEWPDSSALDRLGLDAVEQERFEAWNMLQYLNVENLHYQYELGLLDQRFYELVVTEAIKRAGPVWKRVGFVGTLGRPSFHDEIERILALAE